jgi:mannose-6-phosphate isomerase-like protein (cupin superfamily)
VLGENGRLYDTKKGDKLPDGVKPMPLLSDEELKTFPELTAADVVPGHVARYWDLMALAEKEPAKVIGADARLRDRPGFEVELLTRGSIPGDPYAVDRHEVLMVFRGHWRLTWDGGETVLAPGDTCAVPPNLKHSLVPSMTGEASLYRVRNTDDPAGPTHRH